ncbi:uncharacterized protein METZ01_LOCUS331114, partial [marine metagenome]
MKDTAQGARFWVACLTRQRFGVPCGVLQDAGAFINAFGQSERGWLLSHISRS